MEAYVDNISISYYRLLYNDPIFIKLTLCHIQIMENNIMTQHIEYYALNKR